MAWKGRKRSEVDFDQLLTTLQNSRIHQTNNALWQTIQQLILKSQGQRDFVNEIFQTIISRLDDNSVTTINIKQNLDDATFWTQNDETLTFPSALQVLAGLGIILDYSVPNKVTINSSLAGGVLPMVNGEEPPELMSNGAGDLIIIPYSLGP